MLAPAAEVCTGHRLRVQGSGFGVKEDLVLRSSGRGVAKMGVVAEYQVIMGGFFLKRY